MELKDIIALILGTIGTTLGVLNMVRSMWDDRVRLRVIPGLSYVVGDGTLTAHRGDRLKELLREFGQPTFSVEVVNLSKFPVTIDEVGLCEGDIGQARAPFHRARIVDGTSLPRRLDSREALTLLSIEDHASSYSFTSSTRAYATASCDTTRYGTSHTLEVWVEIASANRKT